MPEEIICLDVYWTIDRSTSEVSVETGLKTEPVRAQRYPAHPSDATPWISSQITYRWRFHHSAKPPSKTRTLS